MFLLVELLPTWFILSLDCVVSTIITYVEIVVDDLFDVLFVLLNALLSSTLCSLSDSNAPITVISDLVTGLVCL
jgi:hypothetical protein